MHRLWIALIALLLLVGCGPGQAEIPPVPTRTPPPIATPTVTLAPTATPIPEPTNTPAPTVTPAPPSGDAGELENVRMVLDVSVDSPAADTFPEGTGQIGCAFDVPADIGPDAYTLTIRDAAGTPILDVPLFGPNQVAYANTVMGVTPDGIRCCGVPVESPDGIFANGAYTSQIAGNGTVVLELAWTVGGVSGSSTELPFEPSIHFEVSGDIPDWASGFQVNVLAGSFTYSSGAEARSGSLIYVPEEELLRQINAVMTILGPDGITVGGVTYPEGSHWQITAEGMAPLGQTDPAAITPTTTPSPTAADTSTSSGSTQGTANTTTTCPGLCPGVYTYTSCYADKRREYCELDAGTCASHDTKEYEACYYTCQQMGLPDGWRAGCSPSLRCECYMWIDF